MRDLQNFTVFGGSYIREAHDGSDLSVREPRKASIGKTAVLLAALLLGATTVATGFTARGQMSDARYFGQSSTFYMKTFGVAGFEDLVY